MDNCSIKPYKETKTWSVIKELEHNDGLASTKLLSVITTKDFVEYIGKDSVVGNIEITDITYDGITNALESVNKNTLKRIIKAFRRTKFFDPKYSSSIDASSGLYNFKSMEVFEDAKTHMANILFNIFYNADERIRKTEDFRNSAIKKATNQVRSKVIDIFASLTGVPEDENVRRDFYKNFYKIVPAEKGKMSRTFDFDRYAAVLNYINENGNDIEKNYCDLALTLDSYKIGTDEIKTNSQRFMSEVFANKKISQLYVVTDEFDIEDVVKSTIYVDEDHFEDGIYADDSVVSTDQWLMDSIKSSSDKFAGELVRLYFESLPKLNSTTNNYQDFYRNNSFGAKEYHNYSDCNNQILTILTEWGGFRSYEDFIDALDRYAEQIPQYRAFAKVAEDFMNNKDIGYKIFTDLRNKVMPKIRLSIANNEVDVHQANPTISNENATTLRLINDINSSLFRTEHGDNLEAVDNIRNIFITNKKHNAVTDDRRIITTEFLKTMFKKYFPNIDTDVIDTYIKNKDVVFDETSKKLIAPIDNNILNLLDKLKLITTTALNDFNKYNINEAARQSARIINREIREGRLNRPYEVVPEQKLLGESLTKAVAELARELSKYTPTKAEYTSRNIEGKQQSDVLYNNYLTFVTNSFTTKTGIDNYIRSKFRGSNLRYSNLLSNHKLAPFISTETPNGRAVTAKMIDGEIAAAKIIRMMLIDGVENTSNDNAANYGSMSDIDYMGLGLASYIKGINDYSAYSTEGALAKGVGVYIMPTPSDAPKNFMITLPKYSAGAEQIEAVANIIKAQIFDSFKSRIRIGRANSVNDLIENYDYRDASEWKEFNGNIFKYDRLFGFNGRIDTKSRITKIIDTFFGNVLSDTEALAKALNYDDNGHLNAKLPESKEFNEAVNNLAKDWIKVAKEAALVVKEDYTPVFDVLKVSDNDFENYYVNFYIAQTTIDDLFRGAKEYYKNAQTIAKRDKQVQAGGKMYGTVNLDGIESYIQQVSDTDEMLITTGKRVELGKPKDVVFTVHDKDNNPLRLRTGFNAITIRNSVRFSSNAKGIYNELVNAGIEPKIAEELSAPFGYNNTNEKDKTKVNDAQSYVTIWEAARRIKMRGDFPQYAELLDKLTDRTTSLDEIDAEQLTSFIQVMKHFYYDQYYDETYDMEVSRQIKNAEFVLIPKMLGHYETTETGEEIYVPDTSLGSLLQLMMDNDIDQVNTQETSKASNYDIIDFWDKDGNLPKGELTKVNKYIADRKLQGYNIVKPFSYSHLYIQQDVPQHMEDTKNKAGIQIIKKVLDNIREDFITYGFTKEQLKTKEVQEIVALNRKAVEAKQRFIENYVANIREDFENLMKQFGVKFDDNGNIIGGLTGNIDFDKVYAAARQELSRLGIDSNILDYVTPINGETIMPTFMNIVGAKIESIANAQFNRMITRQKLPGWHAAQVTSVGMEGLIQRFKKEDIKGVSSPVEDESGRRVELAYHKDKNIVEILLPAWTKNVLGAEFKDIDENVLEMIGYRIPTEGKQSMAVMKVVGFLPKSMGSTVVVPDEWVTQTGSDFDVDSVYAIIKETYKDEDGKVHVVDENHGTDRQRRNTAIVESMIDILNSPMATAENLSRSNFDDVTTANKYVDDLKGTNEADISPYTLDTQIRFRRNATGGLSLKGLSVMLDTACSVFSETQAYFPEGGVLVNYGNETVKHNKLGWSENANRNRREQFITVDSSHTTAHILDAIKEGSIENENEYTFQAYKLLYNLGVDANTAILWIRQPGISEIVKTYFDNNSVFVDSSVNPIQGAIKSIAAKLNLQVGKELVNQYTPIETVLSLLQKKYGNRFEELFSKNGAGSKISLSSDDNTSKQGVLTIDFNLMIERFNPNSTVLVSEEDKLLFDLGMIINFNAVNKQAAIMMNYAKILNTDKFGAAQSIFATREFLNNITELLINGQADQIHSAKTNNNLVESIYQGFGESIIGGHFDINKYFELNKTSSYPILNAFLKYATIASYAVNSQLFATEAQNPNGGPSFHDAIDNIRNYTNRYNEPIYNAFKRYAISYFINRNIDFFTYKTNYESHKGVIRVLSGAPLETDNPVKENRKEIKRIYGYGRLNSKDIEIRDVSNPTEEDVEKFSELSPAEKVDFIKKHLTNSTRSIFDYLTPRLVNYRQLREINDSAQTIRYTDNYISREELYRLFKESFYNNNILIRMTAVDLIKYAYVVEGNNFRYGNIAKIIPNDALYNDSTVGGLNIIEPIKEIPNIQEPVTRFIDENIYEKFIQGHSEMLGFKTIKDVVKTKKGQKVNLVRYIPKGFDKIKRSRIYKYNLRTDAKHLLDLGLITKLNDDFVPTTNYINVLINNEKVLYKIITYYDDFYLVPLNKLLPNETTDYSILDDNNVHPTSLYWEEFIKQDDSTIKQESPVDFDYLLPPEKESSTLAPLDENYVDSKLNTPTEGTNIHVLYATNVNKLLGDVPNKINEIFYSTDSELKNRTIDGKGNILRLGIRQTILNSNGEIQNYIIERHKLAKTDKLSKELKDFIEKNKLYNSNNFYLVTKYTPETLDSVDDVPSDMRSSVDFDNLDLTLKTKLAKQQIQDIRTRTNNDEQAKLVFDRIQSVGINPDAIESIELNSDEIIRESIKYHGYKARELKRRLNDFDKYGHAVNDPNVIAKLKTDEKLRKQYLELYLDAITFGRNFNLINEIPLDNFTVDAQRDLRQIREAIIDVKNSTLLKEMNDIVLKNIYEPLSTNINITQEIAELKDYIFKDGSLPDRFFQDAQELGIPLVQIILKQAWSRVAAEKMAHEKEIKDVMREINKQIDEAAKNGTPINWNKIISATSGRFLLDFDEKWFDDYRKLQEKVNDLRQDKGIYDKDYLRAKQELNVWLNKNSHQKYVASYYKALNDAVAPMLEDDAIDIYSQYLQLRDRRNELLGMSRTLRTADEQRELEDINKQIVKLTNFVDEFGDIIPNSVANQKLSKYINDYSNIKSQYFVRETREGFNEDLQYYLNIIKKKEIRNANGELVISQSDLMLDKDYVDAKNWLIENTRRVIDEDVRNRIKEAFATLRRQEGNTRGTTKADDVFKKFATDDKYDYKGEINGTLFSETEAAAIKAYQQQQFSNFENDRNTGEARLIRNRGNNDIVFSGSFYSKLRPADMTIQTIRQINETVDAINKILVKARRSNGKIYLTDLTNIDDLKELDKLYQNYHSLRGWYKKPKNKEVGEFFAKHVKVVLDEEPYKYDIIKLENGNYSQEYYDAWKKVANGRIYDEEGQAEGEQLQEGPNEDIYGYLSPKDFIEDENGEFVGADAQYVDKEKTKAKRFINEAVEFVPTEYFYAAREAASAAGNLAEFESKNMIYNPYSRKFEPIRIWTKLNLKGEYANAETFAPNYNNTVSTPFQTTINDDFNYYSYKYNGSEEYKKDYGRTKYEEAISKLMIDNYFKYAKHNVTANKFTSNLMFPRRGVANDSMINRVKQLLNAFGFGYTISDDRFETNNVGYEFDRINNLPLTESLKNSKTIAYKEMPDKSVYSNETDYQNAVKEVREFNRLAREENEKIDVAIMSKDYKSVFEEFMKKAVQTNAVEDTKLDLYYLLEWLRHNDAVRTSGFGNLLRDKFNSAKDLNVPATQTPSVAIEMVERWCRRFLFDEFKRKNRFDALAGFAQNFTSTKYMMVNIPGGIGNVLTGTYNIMQERTAEEFFGHSHWESAKFKYYVSNIPAFIRNSTRGESDNVIDAVIKMMNILDYNDITEISRQGDYTELVNKLRNAAYFQQTAGEHFLQNTAMLAMMLSNRIYTDNNGKLVVGSLQDYTRDAHIQAMQQILDDNAELKKLYNNFKKKLLRDENKRKNILWFQTDINGEFLRMLGDNNREEGRKYAALYQEKIKSIKNELAKEFETKPVLIEQFELDDPKAGIAQIKQDSPLTWKMLGEFKAKVVSVNKKINGIYDKLGAGGIESMWVFGSLAMQYHKHIYMNIMKRYRTTGYWNESRQAVERGFIADLWNLVTYEFKDFKKKAVGRNENDDDKQLHFMEAVQQLCRAAIDTIIDFKFRYNTMNPAQRANIRRAVGSLYYMFGGLALGFGASFALLAMGGNDDEDDLYTLLANLALYEADDVLTQVQAFELGLPASTDKIWGNPIAVLSTVDELGKLASFAAKMVTQGEDFNINYTNGRYKGENKFKVMLLRQIPIYSRVDRLLDINRNNSYYKLGDNLMSVIPVKAITKWVME